jgi:predicted amidohydrolase
VVVAPEWFFLPKDRLHTQAEVRALREALLTATAGRDVLLVAGTVGYKDARGRYHNTALVIANGALLVGYDKCADGGDADLARRHRARFARGSETPIVRWRGLDVGIEICRDHGDGLLRFRLLTAPRARVDLHVVVSAGVGPRHVAAGLGGVLVHVDGCTLGAEEACSTVVRRRARKDETGRAGETTALSPEITARRFVV